MKRLALTILPALLLASCVYVEGSGRERQERREMPAFEKVEISGAMEVSVEYGEKPGVELSGDDNLLCYIETKVVDGELKVRTDGAELLPQVPLVIKVTAPKLQALEVSGASRATVEGVKEDSLELEVSGASHVVASGLAAEVKVNASGASFVDARDLETRRAELEASGASTIEIRVSEAADAEASGASTIVVVGDARITSEASGGSSVHQE